MLEKTVQVRVQVIDVNAFTLDLVVPTYLPARDLTQRVARDAGLDAYWKDGKRRLYWLRARGRLLEDEEALKDLGVVPGELVYLLPQPPPNSGVVEQPPDYPQTRGYAAKGTLALLASTAAAFCWAILWGMALSVVRSPWTVLLPGAALGIMCTTFARHAWGGQGSRIRVPLTGFAMLYVMTGLMYVVLILLADQPLPVLVKETIVGLGAGMVGTLIGWLAWWGAVEPLPTIEQQQQQAPPSEAVGLAECGICGLPVEEDVRQDCQYRCGRVFHSGCHAARLEVYRGDPQLCAVCQSPIG